MPTSKRQSSTRRRGPRCRRPKTTCWRASRSTTLWRGCSPLRSDAQRADDPCLHRRDNLLPDGAGRGAGDRRPRAGERRGAPRCGVAALRSDLMLKELTTHAYIEETIFYPTARAAVPETEDHVLESVEEHHVVAWLLSD